MATKAGTKRVEKVLGSGASAAAQFARTADLLECFNKVIHHRRGSTGQKRRLYEKEPWTALRQGRLGIEVWDRVGTDGIDQ